MSLNAFMHPRNPYFQNRPNFATLAKEFPEFAKVVSLDLRGKIKVDFGKMENVRILTKTLLKKDFNLDVEIPEGVLVPTLSLRLNYLLWIEDLLIVNGLTFSPILGFDIGVGASCIYPLLASRYLHWKMKGSEVDHNSLKLAKENVTRNGLNHEIELVMSPGGRNYFNVLNDNQCGASPLFSMCNPPFFNDSDGLKHLAGKLNEVATIGGEVEFIQYMVNESQDFRNKIKIFTCMIGCKSSLLSLKVFFQGKTDLIYSFTEFYQGKTTRWGLAWTFHRTLCLNIPSNKKVQNSRQNNRSFTCLLLKSDLGLSCGLVFGRLSLKLSEIDVEMSVISVSDNEALARLKSFTRNWKHQRRKRRRKFMNAELKKLVENSSMVSSPKEVSFKAHSSEGFDGRLQLECLFCLHRSSDSSEIFMDVTFISGESGKEGMHQLIQYIRNKINIKKSI